MADVTDDTLAADRLVSIGKLSGSLGHELNNLLTGILVFAETMSRATEGSALHEDSQEILSAARRATELLKGFVQLSQGIARGRALEPLLETLRPLLHYRAHLSAMRLELQAPFPLPALASGSGIELQHLVVNLVLRAIEGGVPGQVVRLCVEREERSVRLWAELHGTGEGSGARAWLPRVVQDLAIVEALAARLGGSVELEGETPVARLPVSEV